MRIDGSPTPPQELEAFCQRLNEITSQGGQIQLVQVYTVARRPAESYVTALSNEEVNSIVNLVQQRTGLEAHGFYGPQAESLVP
jgi:hypothetical protein